MQSVTVDPDLDFGEQLRVGRADFGPAQNGTISVKLDGSIVHASLAIRSDDGQDHDQERPKTRSRSSFTPFFPSSALEAHSLAKAS